MSAHVPTTPAENRREARRATRFFARALGRVHEFVAARRGDIVFVCARGEKGEQLSDLVHEWGGLVERVP